MQKKFIGIKNLTRKSLSLHSILFNRSTMSIKHNYIALIILYLFLAQGLSSQISFRRFDVSDGLSDNTIQCINQDAKGYIWLGTYNGLCRFDGKDFITYKHLSNDTTTLSNMSITSLEPSKDGMWVGTERGFDFLSFHSNKFRKCKLILESGKLANFDERIKNLITTSNHLVALGNSGNIFIRKDGLNFEQINYNNRRWLSICAYKENCILARANDGIYILDVRKRTIIARRPTPAITFSEKMYFSRNQQTVFIGYGIGNPTEAFAILPNNSIQESTLKAPANIRALLDYRNQTYFGTDGQGLIENVKNTYTTRNSNISGDVIYSLFADKDNNFWIGTYRNGLNLYSNNKWWFKSITEAENQITHNLVTAIAKRDNSIFIGLDGGGLNIFDKNTDKSVAFTSKNSQIAGDNILSISDDGQNIWLGIYRKGISKFSPQTNAFKNYPLPPNTTLWEIKDDGEDNIWIAGQTVCVFNKKTETYSTINDLMNVWASDIKFTENAVWISTTSNGIYKIDKRTKKILKNYSEKSANLKLDDNTVKFLFIDSNENIWFSPRNLGLFKLDEKTEKITSYGERNGLTDLNITSMIEDGNGKIWLGTNNGLFRYNPKANVFTRFGKSDNLPSTQFNFNACLRDGNMLYFGSTKGVVYFNSKDIHYNQSVENVLLDNIKILNNNQTIHLLSNNPEQLKLSSKQNFFTINYSLPEFLSPEKILFSCKMENFDKNWRDLNDSRQVSYTNVPPGKYTFKIRSTDREGKWNDHESVLQITINPPWWKTPWAIFWWSLLATIILLTAIRIAYNTLNNKHLAQTRQIEINMEKKANEIKLRFFTNISHELRTPLTLIISPLEAIIKTEKDENSRMKLSKINRHAHDLLNLVNQLLDFRKLEITGEKLKLSFGNLVEFTENIFLSFEDMANNQKKNYSFTSNAENLYMSFDKDKVRKIINNLLSNAFKYTSTGDSIKLTVGADLTEDARFAVISVSDSGKGISASEIEHIFDRFHQVEDTKEMNIGSGIGLHLVKEYINLHGGTISVESAPGKGSSFSVRLPITEQQGAADALELKEEKLIPAATTTENKEKKTVLLVEDNTEFRLFMTEQLDTDFRVIQAADGVEGEIAAIEHTPDIIISDYMMPKMDGAELCKKIKLNIKTSHIPIIMLSAKASDEAILTGYEAGADDYIPKPFNLEILILKIKNLIKQREERIIKYRENIEVTPSALTITSLDEKLIQNVLETIEKNMSNTEYSIDDLSAEVGVGRTNLYNKIQSITGETPNCFIRRIRLKRAAQLLRDTDLNVSEIADLVGFGTIKYFNKYFKEEYSNTPTEYRNIK